MICICSEVFIMNKRINAVGFSICRVLCRNVNTLPKYSKDNSYYDIVIAGGGMVGTTLACVLGQATKLSGKKILLLEGGGKQGGELKPEYSNRVSSLNPGTRTLLEDIGVWRHIASARVQAVKKMQVWEACSDAVITFNYDDMAEDVAYIVENDVLLSAVNKELEHVSQNVTVVYHAKIKGYQLPHDDADVVVDLENGSSYHCNLLVGADGANSQVRKAMGVQYLAWNYNQMGVVATLELSEETENVVAWQRFLPTGPLALLPLNNKLSSLVWSTSSQEANKLLALPEGDFVDALNDALWKKLPRDNIVDIATQRLNAVLESLLLGSNAVRQLHPSVSAVVKGSRAAFPLGFGHSTHYVAKGVALVGDSAHRVHPLAGQGVNLGFGDVQCLSTLLSDAVYNGETPGSLSHLLKYETIRQRHNLPTMLAIDGLQKLYGTTITPVVLLRSLGLQCTDALFPVKKMIMNHAAA